MESRQIDIGRGEVWWSLGISLTQLSPEIHFWILFLSCWLGTAPGALFYENSWEIITELEEQGARGKKQIWESSEMIEISWVGMVVWLGNVHTLSPPSPISILINNEDFHSLPHFLYICSWKRWGFNGMDFCPAPEELCNAAQRSSSLQQKNVFSSIQPLLYHNC